MQFDFNNEELTTLVQVMWMYVRNVEKEYVQATSDASPHKFFKLPAYQKDIVFCQDLIEKLRKYQTLLPSQVQPDYTKNGYRLEDYAGGPVRNCVERDD